MKKKIILFITMLSILFLLTGCGNVSEAAKNRCKNNGKKLAIKYIKNKYGFEPKIISSNALIEDELLDASKFGEALVGAKITAEYKGKTFRVINSCKMLKNDSKDDYQSYEIKEYMSEYFESKVKNILKNNTNVVSYKVSIKYEPMKYSLADSKDIPYSYSEYFDKNNINDIFLYLLDRVEIISIGESGLSNTEKEQLSKIGHGEINIYNIKNLAEFNEYKRNNPDEEYRFMPKFLFYSIDTNKYWKKEGTWKTEKYYTIVDNGISFISSYDGVFIKPIDSSTYQDIVTNENYTSSKRSYKITADTNVYIYIPAENVSKYNLYDLKIGHKELRGSEGAEYYYQDWYNQELLTEGKKYIYYSNDHIGLNDIIDIYK